MTSLYGIRKQQLHNKLNSILHAFVDTYQNDIVNYYLEIFNSNIEVNILRTAFRTNGVVLRGKEIPWNDLGAKAFTTYYALFSKKDPTIYKSYNYLEDWNTAVVYSLSRQILYDKGLLV